MLKMMIVDDEEIERRALRMMIERYVPEVSVVGEAENGRLAVELAMELQPDLMTMDIKMPGCDGIEAVSLLHERLPAVKFIMVSAFDEFEYARRVMKYGVREYLVKPCKKEHIVNAVRSVVSDIDSEQRERNRIGELRRQAERADAVLEAEHVAALLADRMPVGEPGHWRRLAGITDAREGAAIVVSVAGNGAGWTEADRRRAYEWIRSRIKRQIRSLVGPMTGLHVPVLAFPDETVPDGAGGGLSMRSRLVRSVRAFLLLGERELPDRKLAVGIGRAGAADRELVQSYYEALAASQVPHASGYGFFEDMPVLPDDVYPYPRESEEQLLRAVRRGDAEEAAAAFERYMDELLSMTRYDLERVKYDLQKLFAEPVRLLREHGLEARWPNALPALRDEHELRRHAASQLRMLTERLREWYADEHRGSIERAKAYLAERFDRELSLEETAEFVGLNPHYFSKLFHESCGVTFIDYLTGLRIEKAKELLADPKQILKDISLRVGYRDPNYFSRVFKKTVGVSPSEFRCALSVPSG